MPYWKKFSSHMKYVYYFFTIVGLTFAFFLSFYAFNLQSPNPNQTQKQDFVVNQGEGLATIATRLSQNHLIKNSYVFLIHSRLLGLSSKLQAGTFRLSPSMGSTEIIKKLASKGSTDLWVKIPEGSRNEELDLPYSKEELLIKRKTGSLFPDSYLVPDYFNLDEFLAQVDKNYKQKTRGLNLTTEDTILASLLEREGGGLEDKKIISGILKNRLQSDMPLQVDASIQYVRDSKLPRPKSYWQPIAKSDLKLNSPYNTYLNVGLPPSPICNPSLNSLIAAKNPTQTNYYYYIHEPNGTPHYATTLIEHNENIAKYLK